MTSVLDDTMLASHLARIDRDGYTIVEDAIEPDLVARLATRSAGWKTSSTSRPRGTAAEGHATLRMYNLLAKDPVFRRCRCIRTCCRSWSACSIGDACCRE